MDRNRMNRMMKDGPSRQSIQKILNEDRKIVAHIFMNSAINVLENRYGWNEAKVKEFHDHLQEEIKKF